MGLLLDSHVLLWWLDDSPALKPAARAAIAQDDSVHVSVAMAWEIEIKAALGRLRIPANLEAAVRNCGFLPLSITFAHAARAASLPPYHGDPFDRMLIAQAQLEGLALVTHDRLMDPYGVTLVKT